jgi:CubicO group peptidase (beta-lactamase class C family)
MTVSLDFVESYHDPSCSFAIYREATGWNPGRPELAHYHHGFLVTLGKAAGEHGERYTYLSPNSDMLGWVIERAAGARFAELLSDRIWKPMGAGFDGYITLDPRGASRTAGGICVILEDLARFGEMIRNDGAVDGRQVIPRAWIDDIHKNGDPSLWRAADVISFLPDGRYRSKWYLKGGGSEVMMAIGIHGQWLYIDRRAETVIAKQSSQPLPVDYPLDFMHLDVFARLCASFD